VTTHRITGTESLYCPTPPHRQGAERKFVSSGTVVHELVSDLNESLLVEELREDISQLILCVHVNAGDETRLPEY
jgi:hypothetical protein